MKKVIHYTIGFHYPYQGGVETNIGDIYNMTNDNFEHIILCKNGGKKMGPFTTISSISNQNKKNVFNTDCQKYNYINIPNKSSEFDDTTIDIINNLNPDVLILYGNDDLAMYIPFIKCKVKHKILRIQAFTENEMTIVKNHLPNIKILCFNEQIKNEIVNFNIKNEIVVLNKTYNNSIFNNKDRLDYNKKNIKFLYTGRFSNIKKTIELIKVFQELLLVQGNRDISLKLIGGGTPYSYETKVKEIIKSNKIICESWKSHEQLADEYRNHDCLIIPSYFESFCSSALEALACGCNVITNTNSNNWWTNGLVTNSCIINNSEPSEESLYEGIKYFINNIPYKDNSNYIFNNFSYTKNKQKWINLLNNK